MSTKDAAGAAASRGFVPGRFAITAYGAGGFRFADMSHRGSILALPSGVRAWPPRAVGEITEASLAPVFAERAMLELLLLGTGLDFVPLDDRLRWRLREAGIGLEAMATGPAVRTYNLLVEENRRVGAALIAVA